MKILYAFQGTGNGHISKAIEIIPFLKQFGEVEVLVSGNNFDLKAPFEIKYQKKGITFYYNKKGGIDYIKTFLKLNTFRLLNEIRKLEIEHYDVIINDFEPISAWACKLIGKRCLGFGHQASFQYPETPMPKFHIKDLLGILILKQLSPCNDYIGLHFENYNSNIYSPIIRKRIRNQKLNTKKHITVYLPAINNDHLIDILGRMVEIKFEIFSKQTKNTEVYQNLTFKSLNEDDFIESLANCKGVITHCGFETPAEAIFLGKKLICIPIKGQFEQYCNALSLEKLGIKVLNDLKLEQIEEIYKWYHYTSPLKIEFEDNSKKLAELLIRESVISEKDFQLAI